jgi:ribosomal protein L12E/L44/L45/RPP1/RPP2
MVGLTVSLPAKWEKFLKQLGDDHEIDLNTIVSELCEWSFSDPESKEQFEAWLVEAYPPKGEAEEEARDAGEEAAEEEEEREEESEEESHEHRD